MKNPQAINARYHQTTKTSPQAKKVNVKKNEPSVKESVVSSENASAGNEVKKTIVQFA